MKNTVFNPISSLGHKIFAFGEIISRDTILSISYCSKHYNVSQNVVMEEKSLMAIDSNNDDVSQQYTSEQIYVNSKKDRDFTSNETVLFITILQVTNCHQIEREQLLNSRKAMKLQVICMQYIWNSGKNHTWKDYILSYIKVI